MKNLDFNCQTIVELNTAGQIRKVQSCDLQELYTTSKTLQNNPIKINCRKLPTDFFTHDKRKLSTATRSQRESDRDSKERTLKTSNQSTSNVPLTPSFLINKASGSFDKVHFKEVNSAQLIPTQKPQLQKCTSEFQSRSNLKIKNQRMRELSAPVGNKKSSNPYCNPSADVRDANLNFNCTFSKKLFTNPIPQHQEQRQTSLLKAGQDRRLARKIVELISVQRKIKKKVNEFEALGENLKLTFNNRLFKNINNEVTSSRQSTDIKTAVLPPIESARAKIAI